MHLIDHSTLFSPGKNRAVFERPQAPESTRAASMFFGASAAILGYARDLGIVEANPVGAFRETLRRRSRTQRGRAEADPGRNIRPIEEPAALNRLLVAAAADGVLPQAFLITLLDAGLRVGEALGLKWGSVAWGEDEDDLNRALLITRSRPRGREEGHTKSGRARRVALSRRLRRALLALHRAGFEPGSETLVFASLGDRNFYHREWRRILKRAAIGHRALKDLRDTFASQLLTSGVSLGYVSAQLGHSDVAVTARHYARWAGGGFYREPMPIEQGEVPADLLGRLDQSRHSHTTAGAPRDGDLRSGWIDSELWRAGRDSNPRPSGSKYELAPRSDAGLRLLPCEGMQGAAPGCTRYGSRLYPAPSVALAA